MNDSVRVAYLTDVEGRWDKLVDFTTDNPCVALEDGERLVVADGACFVFGGDSVDRGPAGRRVVQALVEAKRRQPERVVLLAGNRDINKLRLRRELGGQPPSRAPSGLPRPALLQWIFANTMGAADAFAMRQRELAAEDDAVVDSFHFDVESGGCMLAYLEAAQLGAVVGDALFVHGGLSDLSFGRVPGRNDVLATTSTWIDALNEWFAEQVAAFVAAPMSGEAWQPLIRYQAPVPGTNDNPGSVVYRRMLDATQRPLLPSLAVRRRLADAGIRRLLVGHTPMGDVATVVRTAPGDPAPFELVMADNSYSRLERGSLVVCRARGALEWRGRARHDDGSEAPIEGSLGPDEPASPLGRKVDGSGEVIKGRLPDGRWHLFRHLPDRKVEQTVVTDAELATRTLTAVASEALE